MNSAVSGLVIFLPRFATTKQQLTTLIGFNIISIAFGHAIKQENSSSKELKAVYYGLMLWNSQAVRSTSAASWNAGLVPSFQREAGPHQAPY
jgi:hypothetical protein